MWREPKTPGGPAHLVVPWDARPAPREPGGPGGPQGRAHASPPAGQGSGPLDRWPGTALRGGAGSPERRYVVGIADMVVCAEPGVELVTYALGSCLGIAIHDPVAAVGGLLHVMLPLSTIDVGKAATHPYMFVDTGVPRLFLAAYQAGAQKERLEVRVAGGASLRAGDADDQFQIGKRNLLALRKLLWQNGVRLRAEDVGGTCSRTMTLAVGSGQVTIQANGAVFRL